MQIQTNPDSSMVITTANIQVNGGNINLADSATLTGLSAASLNTDTVVQFNLNAQNELQYNNSATVAPSAQINLPAGDENTQPGQIVGYVTKAGVTSVSVNGNVAVGAPLTTLAANQYVAWQAVDNNGAFVRIQ